jgi:hypothetical protein
MPTEAVSVTCVAILKTYAVTATGATADKTTVPRGEVVTVSAVLPEGTTVSDYDISWSSTPTVQFTAGDGTASFEMPAEAVSVICVLIEKPLEDNAIQRVLHLKKGWNPVVLSLIPDAASIVRLRNFPAMKLDAAHHVYVQAREFSAHELFWLYASKSMRIIVTGEAAVMPLPQAEKMQPYGTFPATTLEGHDLWQWLNGIFRLMSEPIVEPGRGYFVK